MRELLKFITCGSVDDGKSTLIGHMLYAAKLLFADQQRALELDSKLGSRDGKLDFSLLLDGLTSEREQGITIDAAYRFFSTEKRTFIAADCPGHEQYTCNMAVGASFADLAIVLADATKGLLRQTRRHMRICSLMGIKHFVVAVNKFDLVSFDKRVFDEISEEFLRLTAAFEVSSLYILPVCATDGDNITTRSERTPWHSGLPLLPYLEQVDTEADNPAQDGFIMPVQRVCRPNYTFRGFQGQVERGRISVGDRVLILPGTESAAVAQIYVAGRPSGEAYAGQSATVKLDCEVDVSRGNVLACGAKPEVGDSLSAFILWMDTEELAPGMHYWLKCGTKTVSAKITAVKYKIDVNNGKHMPADKLCKNDLAVCDLSLSEAIVFDSFNKNKALGGLILINRISNATSACGTILHSLRPDTNAVCRDTDITPAMRAESKGQKPLTIWFTGLSGAGKTVLANALEKKLFSLGKHTMLLDGDNIRCGLNKDLGFKEADRGENIRRAAEVAKLMNEAGIIVLASFISPYENDRENACGIIGEPFKLVYLSASLEVCESRDAKGLYSKARRGELPNFTGINAAYEIPAQADLVLDTDSFSIDKAVEVIIENFFAN